MASMNKKRILIFVEWFYPGFKAGGPIVSIYNLVEELSGCYDLFVFTGAYDHTETTILQGIETDKWIRFKGNAQVYYASNVSLSIIKKAVKFATPDVIYLNSMFSPKFTVLPLVYFQYFEKTKTRRLIISPRGMLIDSNFQIKFLKKRLFIFLFKLLGLNKNLFGHAASEVEAVSIKKIIKEEQRIFIAPNIPNTFLLNNNTEITKEANGLEIYFASRIGREKNIHYTLEVLSSLNLPIKFFIYGSIDHGDYWEKCQSLIQALPASIEVIYKGHYKFSEIGQLFKNHHAFIFPSGGENFSHVIFEALALGKPVITTPEMPWTEIDEAGAGWIISLKHQEEYRRKLTELFKMNQSEYNVHHKSARQYAQQYIEKQDYISSYKSLFG